VAAARGGHQAGQPSQCLNSYTQQPSQCLNMGSSTFMGTTRPGHPENQDSYAAVQLGMDVPGSGILLADGNNAGTHGGGGGPGPGPGFLIGCYDGHGEYGHKVSRFARDHLQKRFAGPGAYEAWRSDPEGSLKSAYKEAEKALTKSPIDCDLSGCTAVTTLCFGGQLVVANAGDSRAVLGRADGGGSGGRAGGGKYGYDRGSTRGQGGGGHQSASAGTSLRAVDLSQDHNPHRPDEAARIR
jgi:hypothetical protein